MFFDIEIFWLEIVPLQRATPGSKIDNAESASGLNVEILFANSEFLGFPLKEFSLSNGNSKKISGIDPLFHRYFYRMKPLLSLTFRDSLAWSSLLFYGSSIDFSFINQFSNSLSTTPQEETLKSCHCYWKKLFGTHRIYLRFKDDP